LTSNGGLNMNLLYINSIYDNEAIGTENSLLDLPNSINTSTREKRVPSGLFWKEFGTGSVGDCRLFRTSEMVTHHSL